MSIRWLFFFATFFALCACEKPEVIPTCYVEKVYDGSTSLGCVHFTDANNGYVGGDDGLILVTHDGGQHWTPATLSSGEDAYFVCVSFPQHDTGWISGRENSNALNNGPAMYKTTDGGITWVSVGTSYDMEYSYFPTTRIGYRDSYTDDIEKSTNGGQSWNVLSSAPYASFSYTSLFFVNKDTGFVGTSSYEWGTTNGGATWNVIDFPSHTLEYNGVSDYAFSDSRNGVAVFTRGDIDITTDGGVTWVNSFDAYNSDFYPLTAVSMPGPSRMIVGGVDYLAVSRDGGMNWEQTYQADGTSFPGHITDIHFYDEAHGFAVTSDGDIFKITLP